MISEIGSIYEDAIFETRLVDGFGVARMLVLDEYTSTEMREILDVLEDPRLHHKMYEPLLGQYGIVFVVDQRAEDPAPFNLGLAMDVLRD